MPRSEGGERGPEAPAGWYFCEQGGGSYAV